VARPKVGTWFYEPKFNGWSMLCHVPSRRLFNGHELTRSTIEEKFGPALDLLHDALPYFNWLHVEGLNNRHDVGKGSLVVLDLIVPDLAYEQRRAALEKALPQLVLDVSLLTAFPPLPLATLTPICADTTGNTDDTEFLLAAWNYLKQTNAKLGCDFYEGMVAKKAGSLYPMQLRKAKDKSRQWVKHRWAF
jgi:hypothetical protein